MDAGQFYQEQARKNAEASKAVRDGFVAARASNLAYALKNGQISEQEAGSRILGLFEGLEAEYNL